MKREQIIENIKNQSLPVLTSEGETVLHLPFIKEKELAAKLSISFNELEQVALKANIIPERYARNMGTTTIDGQIKLLESRVAVIGAGGLGGTIIEFLARMGIGYLVIADGDTFSESNLNRQLLSSERNLGKNKAKVAAERVKDVNSAVTPIVFEEYLTEENVEKIIKDCHVVVDGLDNLSSRFLVWQTAQQMNIPFVHGAIGGFSGHVTTFFPDDEGLKLIYGDKQRKNNHGNEVILGNPAATPLMIAAWQIQEVIKLITGQGFPLHHEMLYMDAGRNVAQIFEL